MYCVNRSVPVVKGTGLNAESLRRSEWCLTISRVSCAVAEETVLRRAMSDSIAATGFVNEGFDARILRHEATMLESGSQ